MKNIILQQATSRNQPFLKFLYESIHEGYSVTEKEYESPFLSQNIDGRELLSTIVDWDGKKLYFDLSDHAFLWNLDALEQCDVYFKANLHLGIAEKFLEKECFAKNQHKIAPFLLFSPNTKQLIKKRKLYKWASKIGKTCEVNHVVEAFQNRLKDSKILNDKMEIRKDLSPDEYHFAIRNLTHRLLSQGELNSYSILTSKGQKGIEDGSSIHPTLNKHLYFLKLISGNYEFINIMPYAFLPWKVTEGLAFDRPLILDHNPLMEMPVGFELKEGTHFLSLLGNRFEFGLDHDSDNPACCRLLNPVSETDMRASFESLLIKMKDTASYDGLKANVMDFRADNLNGQNLCKTIEYYIKLVSDSAGKQKA